MLFRVHPSLERSWKVYQTVKLASTTVSTLRQITGKGESLLNTAKTQAAYDTHEERSEISFTYQRIEVEITSQPGASAAGRLGQPSAPRPARPVRPRGTVRVRLESIPALRQASRVVGSWLWRAAHYAAASPRG